MRKCSIVALGISFALLGMSAPGAAAQKSRVPSNGAAPRSDFAPAVADQAPERLLSSTEGRVLVEMALSQSPPADDQPDCSHLVHQIFAAAGLDYPYKTSSELYAGIPEFQQVRSPQPGDLVVWRGHVGLVVDPAEHSFYSSLDSGLTTQQYDASYWRRRGRPRFYRYLVAPSSEIAALQKPAQRINNGTVGTARVNRITDDTDSEEPSSIASTQPNHANPDRSDELTTAFQLPEDVPVVTANSGAKSATAKPATKDVAQAITAVANESTAILKSADFARLSLPVVIFDQLQVEKLELKHDKGWAQIRVDYRVELNQQQVDTKHRSEKRRWELQRREDGWALIIPQDRVYVPAATATRVISERLYTLSRKNSGDTRIQQASLARLLDAVFNASN